MRLLVLSGNFLSLNSSSRISYYSAVSSSRINYFLNGSRVAASRITSCLSLSCFVTARSERDSCESYEHEC